MNGSWEPKLIGDGFISLNTVILAVGLADKDLTKFFHTTTGFPKAKKIRPTLSQSPDKSFKLCVDKFKTLCHLGNPELETYPPIAEKKGYFNNIIGQYNHTELQVQALYTAYIMEKGKASSEKSLRMKILERLLPAVLVLGPTEKPDIDRNLYSVFEMCLRCRLINWTNLEVKSKFLFKVLDHQYCGDKILYQHKTWCTQAELEGIIGADNIGELQNAQKARQEATDEYRKNKRDKTLWNRKVEAEKKLDSLRKEIYENFTVSEYIREFFKELYQPVADFTPPSKRREIEFLLPESKIEKDRS